ncbi:MAG: hypothetical protein ACI9G1_001287, partial [Pirellulaceae bacterium]
MGIRYRDEFLGSRVLGAEGSRSGLSVFSFAS